MGELINGRTPEEIKRGLSCKMAGQHCNFCSYQIDCISEDGDPGVINRDALALIERLESERDAALAKVPRWISVKERLPEEWQEADGTLVNYQIYMPEYGVDIGNYMKPAKAWVCMGLPCKVTHWMPLPEPPKEGAHADARKPV